MRDIENVIYTEIKNKMATAMPDVSVSGISEDKPSHLPHLSVEVSAKSTDERWTTSEDIDQPITLTVTLRAFSAATKQGAKETVKTILKEASKSLKTKRFTLRSYTPASKDLSGVCRASEAYTGGYDGTYYYQR